MDLSGLPVPYVAGGLAALVLLVLMLRFALRPKRVRVDTPTGLGLPSSAPAAKNSLWGKSKAPAGPEPVAGGGASSWSPASDGGSRAPAMASAGGSSSEHGGIVTGSPAELAELASAAGVARGVAAKASAAGNPHPVGGCPKCGGRFLEGEMEGPTLMVDGVVRDDFQPLLTARECCECGYLEFYTRPVRG
jgi:hypothetical protein